MSKFSSWLGHRWGDGPSMSGLESSVKGTGHFLGDVGQYAAPVVSAFNPLLGAGIAGVSAGLRGKSIADMIKDAAITGGTGYAMNHVGDLVSGAKGLFSGSDAAAGAGAGAAAGSGAAGGASDAAGDVLGDFGSAAPSVSSAARSATASAGPAASGGAKGFFSSLSAKDVLSGAGQAASAAATYAGNQSRDSLARDEFNYSKDQNAQALARSQALDPQRQLLMQILMQRLGLSHNAPMTTTPTPTGY